MIFYLPIYKQNKEDFEEWMNEKAEKRISDGQKDSRYDVSARMKTRIIDSIQREYGRSWEQNRAVGWVKVARGRDGFTFTLGKAHTLKSKNPKKFFELIPPDETYGGWHVIDFSSCISSDEVLNKFKDICHGITSRGIFKDCEIDTSCIVSIYKFVDWQGLISSEL